MDKLYQTFTAPGSPRIAGFIRQKCPAARSLGDEYDASPLRLRLPAEAGVPPASARNAGFIRQRFPTGWSVAAWPGVTPPHPSLPAEAGVPFHAYGPVS